MFITNCVIKHLFHVVPGAHYERMFGQDLNPNMLRPDEELRRPHPLGRRRLDHSRGGKGAHDDAGGGHAHAGAMVYLGDNWPDEYRNRVFMCNLHGNRVNQDLLERTAPATSPITARISCWRTIRGSAAWRCSTAPTAASSSATGPTPANATTTTDVDRRTAASTR